MSRLAALFALFTLTALGCEPVGVCTDLAALSVLAHVADDSGASIEGAAVSYSVDGGDPVDCEHLQGGDYACGYEVEGEITVYAEAQDHEPAEGSAEVLLDDDGCHVVQEQVDLILEAIDAT